MNCPKCGNKMVCLFTSYQCDNCIPGTQQSTQSLPATLQLVSYQPPRMLLQATKLTSVEVDAALQEFTKRTSRDPVILLPPLIWEKFLHKASITNRLNFCIPPNAPSALHGIYKSNQKDVQILSDSYYIPADRFLCDMTVMSLDIFTSNNLQDIRTAYLCASNTPVIQMRVP